MIVIRDINGNVIGRSRNLRGVRTYASKHLIIDVRISETPNRGGILSVRFSNGATCYTGFADFVVLKHFVRNWRNARAAKLFVNSRSQGTVQKGNPL